MYDIPSRALVSQARDGDELAFTRLVDRYGQRLWRFLVARGHNPNEADDLVQEIYEAYRALPRYDERYAVSTWLLPLPPAWELTVSVTVNRARISAANEVAAQSLAVDAQIAVELWQSAQRPSSAGFRPCGYVTANN